MASFSKEVATVFEIARHSFFEGIDCLALIETLETGNQIAALASINIAQAGPTANLIRSALFQRLHMSIMRAYDPIKSKGDQHTRVAFYLLENRQVRDEFRCSDAHALNEAIELWREAEVHPSHGALRHLRNKRIVHTAIPDPNIPVPKYDDLFGLTRNTCDIWEKLAHGTGAHSLSMASQLVAYQQSARSFWRPWQEH